MSTPEAILSRNMTALLAFAVGIIAANLYYAQPLTSFIASSLGLPPSSAGLVITLTQLGYGLGVLFIVPLGDLLENKKLILSLITLAVFALLGVATSSQLIPYFCAALFLGLGASAVQIIVPFAAHFSAEENRGHVVGSLMSGLMMGIMLSRPIAGLLTDLISWHSVFYLSALLMTGLGVTLYLFLPSRQPVVANLQYRDLMSSMATLMVQYSVLRRRAVYQAFMFSAFCLFWTASPLVLSGPDFHLSQTGIAIFALVGVGGAILAPFAGKMADRGWTNAATTAAMVLGALSFLLTHFANLGSTTSLILMTLAAIFLDAGVTANLVLGQRAIFSLPSEYRSRLNGLYIATIFVGGAFGSYIGAWAFAHGGWEMTSWVGCALPTIALVYFATERFTKKT